MGLFSRKGSKASMDDTKSNASNRASMASSFNGSTRNGILPKRSSAQSTAQLPKPPDPNIDPVAYLRSIHAVRERTKIIFEKAKRNQLNHFTVDLSKFPDTAAYVVSIIKRDFAPDYPSIPPHGRWQHFDVGGRPRVDNLLSSWHSAMPKEERTRRLIDLFLVSVLLDAGAGTKWSYKSKENGRVYTRSEGLAVASLEMFKDGLFSGDASQPHRVDAEGLQKLTVESLAKGLQVSDHNPMSGIDGRAGLLIRLSDALRGNTELFGHEARPGNMLDYLLSRPTSQLGTESMVSVTTLWYVLMEGLSPIWPATRSKIQGVSLGDAWPCSSMPPASSGSEWENIVPFHKLTQWLAYSLMVPMTKVMGIQFTGVELMTGLPEYRNGGLLIDTGLLNLKKEETVRGIDAYNANAKKIGQKGMEVVPMFTPDDDVVVEWRAVTVGFLDELLIEVNRLLGLRGADCLSLAQMLEAGTWKGGRELAEVSRPNTKAPPIMIDSDGTVF
ncbi:MAG: hypothetical protein M1814_000530 [Vezdaea aestivalis]|nr:MAG: hypothetical protein M1814_000530 [Vezdaea aestivalis]